MSHALPPLPPDEDDEDPLAVAGLMLLRAIQITAGGIAIIDLFLYCYSK